MASVKSNAKPNIGGAVVDSTKGWFLDEHWAHYRAILSPMAIHHGYIFSSAAPDEENINERVHWSALPNAAAVQRRSITHQICPGRFHRERLRR